MKLETVKIESLTLDPNNARKHSKRNLEAIAASLDRFGQRKPIVVHNGVVIAGNGTVEAAKSLGWKEIGITRCPDDWDAETAKAFALADNRSAELAEWDEILASQLKELDEKGWNVAELGFDYKDFNDAGSDENPYTATINLPRYEIVGEQPDTSDLVDTSKTKEMQAEIATANLPADIKEFLTIAANRHTVFDYSKIAEYYPHATPEIQKLMEKSALVIIDIDDAIGYGYANFVESVKQLRDENYDE